MPDQKASKFGPIPNTMATLTYPVVYGGANRYFFNAFARSGLQPRFWVRNTTDLAHDLIWEWPKIIDNEYIEG
jgi:hypothetical protein